MRWWLRSPGNNSNNAANVNNDGYVNRNGNNVNNDNDAVRPDLDHIYGLQRSLGRLRPCLKVQGNPIPFREGECLIGRTHAVCGCRRRRAFRPLGGATPLPGSRREK